MYGDNKSASVHSHVDAIKLHVEEVCVDNCEQKISPSTGCAINLHSISLM